MAQALPANDAGAGAPGGTRAGRFVLFLVGRLVAALAMAWLILFACLYLLPGVGGDVLGLQLFADRLAVTLPLVLMAGGAALLLGGAIGLMAGRAGGAVDDLLGGLATLLSYLPPFWVGLMLALGLAGTLPAGGFMPWSAGPAQALGSLVLPGLALALPHAGLLALWLREAFGPEPDETEIRALRIGGLSAGRARWEVRLGRALPRVPTLVGRLLGALLIGAMVVENVFYLPGLGRQVLGAALAHDLEALRAGLFLLLALAATLMLLSELGRLALDPALKDGR